MRLYRLECLNQEGDIDVKGYYLHLDIAEEDKIIEDNYPVNKKFDIKHYIVPMDTEDELEKYDIQAMQRK